MKPIKLSLSDDKWNTLMVMHLKNGLESDKY